MGNPEPARITHSFLVRIWCEDLGRGEREWRGRIQHLRSGEVRHVHGLPALFAALAELLPPDERCTTPGATDEER